MTNSAIKLEEVVEFQKDKKITMRRRGILAGIAGAAGVGALALTGENAFASPTPNGTIVDAKAAGVVADGNHDDTAVIQSIFNRMSYSNPLKVVFPAGVIKLTKPLVMPFAPYSEIAGAGMELTIFNAPAGMPVFQFNAPDSHSLNFHDFGISYPSNAWSNPKSQAFFYSATAGTANEDGWYHHRYMNIYIENAYDCWALDANNGKQTLWDCDWQGILLKAVGHSVFAARTSQAIGKPINRFRGIGVFNTGSAGANNTGAAFDVEATDLTVDGLDIEGWRDYIFATTGGGFLHASGLHIEHHVFTQNKTGVFQISNGVAEIENFTFSGQTLTDTCSNYIWFITPDQVMATIRNGIINEREGGGPITKNTGALVEFAAGGSENQTIRVENIHIEPGSNMSAMGAGSTERSLSTAASFPPPDPERVTVQSASYTTTPRDGLVVMTSANTIVTTTPAVVGQALKVKNASPGSITVKPTTGSIDGKATMTLASMDSVTLYWIGQTNWVIVK